MKLDDLRPGAHFRLKRAPKKALRPLDPPSDRVTTEWVFAAGDTLVTKHLLACHLVSGGEYPYEAPDDEYLFRLDREVVPVETSPQEKAV